LYTYTDHELSDLQDLLDEAIQVDFNVQAEDDSPYTVARSLYNTYSQVASGDTTYVQTLKQQFEANGANQIVAESMRNSAQFLGGEESSSSDDDDEEDGEDGMDIDEDQGPPQPVVDEDGFQVVQRGGPGRGR
jgi:pre-rRNA-processing protein TSR2